MSNVRLLILPPPQPGGGPTNAVLRVAAKLREQGIEITTSPLSGWQAALLNVGTGIQFDVLRLLRLGRRLVYRVDGCYSRGTFGRQGRPWRSDYERINRRITLALKIADFVIYQSHFAKQRLDILYERPTGTYEIILNGVDLDQFSPAEKAITDLPTIGCIGTFRANRIKVLVDIARQLPLQHRLLIVGRMDEQCRRDLERFRSSEQANCQIEYVPPVMGDDQLARWYRQIDCFLHPIIGDTCSNAVVEALACGVPVIVPRWSGSSELADRGGIIVEEPPWVDYKAFTRRYAEAVVDILDHYAEYSRRARQRACAALNVVDIAHRYKVALGF